jgi:predicted RNase H-like HicB family nuclease
MVAAMRYTATARRDGPWWVVQCVEQPDAISEAARLEHAARDHREPIAFVVGVEVDDVEVDLQVEAKAVRREGGWALHVDGVGVTQVATLDDAEQQVRDLIETVTGDDASSAEVVIRTDS